MHTWLMTAHRVSWLLMIVGCSLSLAGSGCDGKTSSSDAASVAPASTGGAASDGSLGTGGGSAGSDGGPTVNGGAGGSGGTARAGGATGSGGNTNPSGTGGIASSGGTTGLGGNRDGGDVDSPTSLGGNRDGGDVDSPTSLGGNRDGGDVDSPGTTSSGEVSGLDAAVDGGTEPRCVGTPSNSYCGPSSCGQVPGCYMYFPTDGHCLYETARACSYNTTPTSCAAESGCVWSVDGGSSNACSGTARDCFDGMSRAECEAAGCNFLIHSEYCTGTPTPCTQLSAANCASQPGCALSST